MKSLLFQAGATPFSDPDGCQARPSRQEVSLAIRKDGRVYRFKLRDKVVPEDPYLMLTQATAFAIMNDEPYNGLPPDRSVRDWLIKNTVVV
jgi:hypothetical protein